MAKMKWDSKRDRAEREQFWSDKWDDGYGEAARLERAADKLLYYVPKRNRKLRAKMKRKPVVKLASTDTRRTGPAVIMPAGLTVDDVCGPEWRLPGRSRGM